VTVTVTSATHSQTSTTAQTSTGTTTAQTSTGTTTSGGVTTNQLVDSTPGAFQIPQLGTVSFECDNAFRIRPVFLISQPGAEQVTIRAGAITSSYKSGQPSPTPPTQLSLPFGLYHSTTFIIHQGTEARMLTATIRVDLASGRYRRSGRYFGTCLVRHWTIDMDVKPNG
jgi:hypothetical protein